MSTDIETSISDLLNHTSALEAELDSWKGERDAINARITARERLIAALRSEAELRERRLFDPPAPQSNASPGTNGNGGAPVRVGGARARVGGTADGILAVLDMAKGRPMTASDIYAELLSRGWAPLHANHPENAVRQSLWNLAKQGKVTKLGSSASRQWALKSLNGSASIHAGGGP